VFTLDSKVGVRLDAVAHAQGVSRNTLVAVLTEIIAEDDLFRAILGEDNDAVHG
jgi:hypothetical protein